MIIIGLNYIAGAGIDCFKLKYGTIMRTALKHNSLKFLLVSNMTARNST